MIEADLQKQVEKYLTKKGISSFHLPRKIGYKRRQVAGWWDLLCIGQKEQFWIECKNPEKRREQWKVSDKQADFGQLLFKNKIQFLMSNNYQEIVDFIDVVIG